MVEILEEAELRQRVRPLPVETYSRLTASGFLDENVELLRGIIVDKMVKTPLHTLIVMDLSRMISAQLPPGLLLRAEQPLALQDSVPEPDIAVVLGQVRDYALQHPSTALLVAEVAVSSVRVDRQKAPIYAEAGVAEYWLIMPESRSIEVYTSPLEGRYQSAYLADPEAELRSVSIPELAITPRELFS